MVVMVRWHAVAQRALSECYSTQSHSGTQHAQHGSARQARGLICSAFSPRAVLRGLGDEAIRRVDAELYVDMGLYSASVCWV